MKAAQRVIEYTTKHYASGDTEEMKVLRRRMIQAGIYDPRAVAYFFLGRTALAVGLAALAFFFAADGAGHVASLAVAAASAASSAISGRASISTSASRRGRPSTSPAFPDFMDLLVVCADAGLSMEASLDRMIAASLRLTANALAIRACRIRDKLERCVSACRAEREADRFRAV